MRVVAKDQLVIESAVPYCSKLTTQKLPNATMKKKKKLRKCAKLAQNTLFFQSNDEHKSLFTSNTIYAEKNKINRKKLPSQTDYKNRDKNH